MGRRIKLDDDIQILLVAGIRKGLPKAHYCALAGIHPATFNAWMDEAEQEIERRAQGGRKRKRGERFLAFYAAIKRAKAEWVEEQMTVIKSSADSGHWTAAAWLLERRLPGEFGRRVDVGVQAGSVLPFSADELAEAERELNEWLGAVDEGDPAPAGGEDGPKS